MYEATKKYSEEMYYRKEDLANELEHYVVDTVWNEILAYRAMFRYDVSLAHRRYYFVLNAYVLRELCIISQRCYTYQMKEKNTTLATLQCRNLSNEDMAILQTIAHQHQTRPAWDIFTWVNTACVAFGIERKITRQLLELLLDDHLHIFVRLYVFTLNLDKRCTTILQCLLLIVHDMLVLIEVVETFCAKEDIGEKQNNFDFTYYLLEFLQHIGLKLSNIMVLLDGGKKESVKYMQLGELLERTPALTKEQVTFYTHHRESNHFYTIAQYMDACSVCYETARYSLEKLVEEHWYLKRKVGKKFVYYVI